MRDPRLPCTQRPRSQLLSFMSEGRHRLHARRATGGNPARKQRHSDQDHGHRQEGRRIERFGLEEQAFEHAREREGAGQTRSEEHTSELQSHSDLVCRLLLEKKKKKKKKRKTIKKENITKQSALRKS